MVAAIAVVVAPILTGQSLWHRDLVLLTFPLKRVLRERLLAGQLGLWNPLMGLGRPLLGMVQPAALYPLDVLMLLPVPLGLNLFLAAHLFILAFGARAWARRIGASDDGAALSGLVIALSGYVVAMLDGNGAYMVGAAWVPWALAFAADARDATGWARASVIARLGLALAATVIAGDPQATHLSLGLCALQALGRGDRRAIGRSLALLAAGAALAGLIAAAQLVPALEAARLGRPGGVDPDDAAHFALHPARLLELAWARPFGEPLDFAHWWHRALDRPGEEIAYPSLFGSLYLGLATPLLALAALTRRRRELRLLGLCAVVLAVIAVGRHAPLWDPFFRWVPGVGLFRYPEKYVFPLSLCLAALAGCGLDAALAAPRRAALVGAGAVALLGLGALAAARSGAPIVAWLSHGASGVDVTAAAAQLARQGRVALALGVACLAPVALVAAGWLAPSRLPRLLVAIVAVDLALAAFHLLDWVPGPRLRERSPIVDDLRAEAGQTIAPIRLYRSPETLLTLPGGDPIAQTRGPLVPDVGMEDGVNHVEAYDYFHTDGESALWAAFSGRLPTLMRITATRFALLPDRGDGDPPPGLARVMSYPGLGASLMEVEGDAPRVYLAQHTIPVGGLADGARAIAAPGFRPGVDAVVEGEARETDGACALDRFSPEAVDLHCDAAAPGWAILADAPAPGWRARVDGREAPIAVANLALRAIPVPAGRSTVELRYRPPYFAAALLASGLGLALAAALEAMARRRRAMAS